VRGAGCHV